MSCIIAQKSSGVRRFGSVTGQKSLDWEQTGSNSALCPRPVLEVV
jgi:hypothetical protein